MISQNQNAAENENSNSEPVLTRAEFYQTHLDRVSRSFAFCIARLNSPLRESIGLAYILCRLVDTVEDAIWLNVEDQKASFRKFDSFMRKMPTSAELKEWIGSIPTTIPESEKLLLAESECFFSDFHELDLKTREALLNPILNMSAGMSFFMDRRVRAGELRLRDLADVNTYCFFVAGVVGEMLTKLLRAQFPDLDDSKVLMSESYGFGLYLQKINLLKDQAGDELEGRFLIPNREEVRLSLEDDARSALRYLLSLPVEAEDFRVFCGWSLFLGLASLPWIDRAARENTRMKISREETFDVLEKVEESILNNEGLQQLFDKMTPGFGQSTGFAAGKADPQALSLYRGDLTRTEVESVFLS